MILNENSFMFILILIFRLYVFNHSDKIIHRSEMLNFLND